MPARVYLDYNATAPLRPEAAEAMARAAAIGANPSSVHALGRAARAAVEEARAAVADLSGARPANVVFTSGGTEANALGVMSAAASEAVSVMIIGATEHDAVTETARASGKPFEIWPVDADGRADLDWLERRLATAGPGMPFVALMAANNETGVVQPVPDAAALVRAAGGRLHVDAVQTAGRVPIDIEAMGADTLAVSAHKLGGPQGVGALVLGDGAAVVRQLHGGGQERGYRAGTENVGGVAGFGAAAKAAARDLPGVPSRARWRDGAAERLKAAGAVVAGEGTERLADVLCVAVPDWPSELQVIALDLAGVMVSAGSACSSGKVKPSRVLAAMGRPDLAVGSLRASGGWASSEADWIRFADAWIEARARRKPHAA